MKTRKRWVILLLALLFIVGMTVFIVAERAGAPSSEDTLEPTEQIEESDNTEEAGFDKTQYSVDQPGSLWWIVNRDRPLPDGYTPPDLIVPSVRLRLGGGEEQMQFSQQARPSLEAMFEAAADDGVELVFGSGYRSEGLQAQFYNSYAARDGQAAADRYSARPGTSEHQTGLAFDVTSPSGACHLEICFEGLPEGQWVQDNAHRYGFIIRYLEGKEAITGYQYEPWHLRYVGDELATELHENGQTMEKFFDLTE